ncbi:hypothetical protein [Dyella mobilis]|uniref:Lipocalin-like domain-containing protein n=1 Tax=Dyella mobilis TaxID=1849582 RepID=A0ABS2KEE5_9GAMM|nr:hypothetical protein [Dyella mobilis]MBM7129543.1 hypothetical protein [Dyella mobilis]GLQ98193.1 hypothetical protein GCM10007863_26130 [Dyella mobilis]
MIERLVSSYVPGRIVTTGKTAQLGWLIFRAAKVGQAFIFATMLILTSCASDSVSVRLAKSEVVGTYYFGDGIGPGEELVLHSNGTFDSTISGDLITKPVGSGGTWTLDAEKITFHDAVLARGGKPFHTFALTQTYKNQIVLIPGDDAKRKHVSLNFVYRKQPDK